MKSKAFAIGAVLAVCMAAFVGVNTVSDETDAASYTYTYSELIDLGELTIYVGDSINLLHCSAGMVYNYSGLAEIETQEEDGTITITQIPWITKTDTGLTNVYDLSGTADEPGSFDLRIQKISSSTGRSVGIASKVPVHVLSNHAVHYDANGGTGSMDDSVVTNDINGNSDVTLSPNGFTRAGYTFTGWKIGNELYQPGQIIPVGPATTLTAQAQWSENTLTVSADNLSALSRMSYGNQISAVASNGASLSFAMKSCTGGNASVNSGGTVTYEAPTVTSTQTYSVTVTVTATFADASTIAKDVSFFVTVDPVLSFTNAATSGTLSVKGA